MIGGCRALPLHPRAGARRSPSPSEMGRIGVCWPHCCPVTCGYRVRRARVRQDAGPFPFLPKLCLGRGTIALAMVEGQCPARRDDGRVQGLAPPPPGWCPAVPLPIGDGEDLRLLFALLPRHVRISRPACRRASRCRPFLIPPQAMLGEGDHRASDGGGALPHASGLSPSPRAGARRFSYCGGFAFTVPAARASRRSGGSPSGTASCSRCRTNWRADCLRRWHRRAGADHRLR